MSEKLTQKQVRELLDEWSAVMTAIDKTDIARRKALAPALAAYHEAEDGYDAKHGAKAATLRSSAEGIETRIKAWLKAQDKAVVVAGETAEAVNEVKTGSRVADPKKFFEKVKDRGAAFWDCLNVGIAKAEALIGAAELETISTAKTKMTAVVRMKG